MRKYTVEVRLWAKQTRPGGRSGEYEMTLEEANDVKNRLIERGVRPSDINVREV